MENGIDLENDLVAFLKDIVKNDHDYIDIANVTGSVATVIINDEELKRHLENADITATSKNIETLKNEMDTDVFEEYAEDYISEVIAVSHSIFSLNGNRNGDEEDDTYLEDDYN